METDTEQTQQVDARLVEALYKAVAEAHRLSAFRDNVSSNIIKNVSVGSDSYTSAIAAAILSIGGQHAPIHQTMQILEQDTPWNKVENILDQHHLVPGWGNGFVKGKEDPLWEPVDLALKPFTDLYIKIWNVTDTLHDLGKFVYPNPSCYTAALALLMGIPKESAAVLFISFRLPSWTEIWNKSKLGT